MEDEVKDNEDFFEQFARNVDRLIVETMRKSPDCSAPRNPYLTNWYDHSVGWTT